MRRLLKEFLEEKFEYNGLHDEYDYNFCKKNDKELFIAEFRKFIGMYELFFYYKNRLVTVINSYEIQLDKKVIEHLCELYKFAKENDMYNEKVILIDFLYTYYKSIISKEYRENNSNFKKVHNDFIKTIEEKNLKKDFFTKLIHELYVFYKELIQYGINNEIYIDSEIINRIFNNLNGQNEYYNEIINIFINNKKNLYNIIEFDNEKEEHIDVYVEYMENYLDEFGGYNYVKEMLNILDCSNVLTLEICRKIINKYIGITNEKCKRIKEKNDSFIKELSEIDSLKQELNYILRNINSLDNIQRDKIRECIVQLLRLKRYIVSDHDHVKNEMHEFSNEILIDKMEVEKCKHAIVENKYKLYASSKVDFDKEIGVALESYAEHAITSIVSNFQIDSSRQIYSLNIEKKEKREDDNFKKYFDEKGKEYTLNHPKLMNKLNKDYYEELLRYLSKTFCMHQDLIILILGDEFKNTIEKLKIDLGYEYDNEYAIGVNNILAIEQNIINVLEEKGLPISEDGFENINNLVEIYKDDSTALNGLMYLNYILYEKSGMNLRNDMMHGNLIHQELSKELLVTFAGLIFVSWLRNDKE